MSDCETYEDEWEEEIDMNACDKCGERVFPSETYCTIDKQYCRTCFQEEV